MSQGIFSVVPQEITLILHQDHYNQEMANYPHSIPTPPFSPHVAIPHPPDHPLRSTANLLESLVSFYQQERMWVYRTRAELEEEALQTQPSDCSSIDQMRGAGLSTLPSPSPSTSLGGREMPPDSFSVKTESEDASRPTSPSPSNTRWNKRKRAFKLKLDNLAPKPKRAYVPRPTTEDASQPSVRILEMYESMMAARMESCQRINRLIRDANRADLHLR
ncbi:hypothetical protein EYR40_005300 [Pleurotus pulmonarius]|nr:hypothetical protein EYR40_005300 [Pleurotus pulmonarius]